MEALRKEAQYAITLRTALRMEALRMEALHTITLRTALYMEALRMEALHATLYIITSIWRVNLACFFLRSAPRIPCVNLSFTKCTTILGMQISDFCTQPYV